MKHTPYTRFVPGSKTAVLLIHGIVGTPDHFRDLVPLIPEHMSVYNMLLDGHGKQTGDFARTSMSKWKAQVQSQLSLLLTRHSRVLIVAHSMGCLFAIREAIRHPDRITGLFLLGVPFAPHVPLSTAADAVRVALGRVRPGSSAEAMYNDCGVHLSPQLWRYAAWLPRFWELLQEVSGVRKLLPQLTVPTQTYQSRHDELVHIRSCKYLAGHPCITNTILPSSGHFAYSPEDLALLRQDFSDLITQYG